MKEQLLEELKLALLDMDGDAAVCLARRIMMAEIPPLDAIRFSMMNAMEIISEQFDEGELFIPQMLLAADAFERTMEVVSGGLASDDGEGKKRAEVYTVEGDIHDIGKNLVALMLKNHGFSVIDLGKDVPREEIIRAARENHAKIIALSALMTTTMQEMKNVIELAKQEGLDAKVMIGGAVITQEYADEIGADGYSKDAADAVRLAQKLCDEADN